MSLLLFFIGEDAMNQPHVAQFHQHLSTLTVQLAAPQALHVILPPVEQSPILHFLLVGKLAVHLHISLEPVVVSQPHFFSIHLFCHEDTTNLVKKQQSFTFFSCIYKRFILILPKIEKIECRTARFAEVQPILSKAKIICGRRSWATT